MSKIELLSADEHGELKVEAGFESKFDDIAPMVQVAADELHKLVLDFPVFITKNLSTGEFELSALLGFSAGENLFLCDGIWNAAYIPLDTRRHPFQALIISDGDESDTQVKVGINVKSNRLTDKGQKLFNDDGTPTDLLTEKSDLLGILMNGLQLTKVFLKALAELDLIEPVEFSMQLKGEDKVTFDGLYTVHAEKLAALSEPGLAKFHSRGYLQACHAVIHSMGHVEKLIGWRSKL